MLRQRVGSVTEGGYVHPFAEAPSPGSVIEILPGLLWTRMPLRLAINHINVWLLRDGAGWTVVDTGAPGPSAEAAWERLFEGALGGLPIRRVICTHMHPDHVGLAGWLARRFGCELWMTRLEYLTARNITGDFGEDLTQSFQRFYRAAGCPEGFVRRVHEQFKAFGKSFHPLPGHYRRIADGECIRIGDYTWQVVVGAGHSPEHACLVCSELGVMIAGDQVLENISSNVSVMPIEPLANPLGDWLDSIVKLRASIADEVLVLPSHDLPFRGLHRRLGELESHHHEALERIRLSLSSPMRAVDIFEALFGREISERVIHLAAGEAIAHLNYLLVHDAIVREPDATGTEWYRMKAGPELRLR